MNTPPPAWAIEASKAMRDEFPELPLEILFAIARALAAERAETEARVERETIERCAKVARDGWMVPPDGGSPTEAETELCDRIEAAIRSLPLTHKEPS